MCFGFWTSWKDRPTDLVTAFCLQGQDCRHHPRCARRKTNWSLATGYTYLVFDLAGLLVLMSGNVWRWWKERQWLSICLLLARKAIHNMYPGDGRGLSPFSKLSTYSCLVQNECLGGTGGRRKRENWTVKVLTVPLQMLRFPSFCLAICTIIFLLSFFVLIAFSTIYI